MNSLSELIASSIGSSQIQEIAKKIGAPVDQTENAIGVALPTLLGALANKSDDQDTMQDLQNRFQQADSSALASPLSNLLGQGAGSLLEILGGSSGGLLGSLLGGRQQKVEQGLGQASGLDSSQISSLLAMLLPVVLGAVGQQSKSKNLDTGGLMDMLKGEKANIQRSSAGSLLGGLLDQDGDGDFDAKDILSAGLKMLKGKS